jgi:ADP-ribose pyrophosphatase YjhB (NUDIX family)
VKLLKAEKLLKSEKTGTLQYGVLPWRHERRLEIMLITSRETYRWVIPKGWPILHHTAPFSAAVEALEEAGVEGEVDSQAIGTYPYVKRLKDGEVRPLNVEVFALRVTRELPDWPEQGQRQRRWFTLREAAQSVDEQELGDIIRAFSPAV